MKFPINPFALVALFSFIFSFSPPELLAKNTFLFSTYLADETTVLDTCSASIIELSNSLEVISSNPNVSYLWDTGDSTAMIIVSEPGTYCVTVTNEPDCYLELCHETFDETCSVNISRQGSHLFATAQGGNGFYSYEWDTGENTNMITPTSGGDYCVTVTDTEDCLATDCIYFNYADSSCLLVINPIVNGLEANMEGAAPFQYEWDNGAQTQSILPTMSGDYCVTATDATGCTNTACQFFNYIECSLAVVFLVDEQQMKALPSGTVPFTYTWNTGATTQTIPIETAGEYCVTMTDNNGCSKTACNSIQANYQITGEVLVPELDSATFDAPLMVYLIQENTDGAWQKSDSVLINASGDNHYNFSNTSSGRYLVQAAFLPEAPVFEDYFPTYFEQSLWWNEADVIELPRFGPADFSIEMISSQEEEGPGLISGTVTNDGNFTNNSDVSRKQNASGEISILLLDESNQAIRHTIPDENGNFSFDNLPLGMYQVYAQVLSFEQPFYMVNLTQQSPVVNNLSFDVTETTITETEEIFLINDDFQSYPNPVSHHLTILWTKRPSSDVQISLVKPTGKLVFAERKKLSSEQSILLDVSAIAPGMYFLILERNGQKMTQKVVVF